MKFVLIQICHQENEPGDSRLDTTALLPNKRRQATGGNAPVFYQQQAGGPPACFLLVSNNPSWHSTVCIHHL